ncbi:unnamed protein product [Bursaphelenchus xylophilus]|uniref:(pine wood nematode) hypothetical protein n=1 Tax=Bursaphelenchus xylophilus TaxID=6326 RepID=A0A7I8XGL6_BURXY|nr:unnamed protein product [Bursaphelenchus xylophilus]CAG9081901.1 unnamed protein product [Bursaphelenchus xylophilus]
MLMYILGALDVAFWCGGGLTNIFLTLNRCCVMYSMKLNETIFGPGTVYIWISLSVAYYFGSLFFVPPPLFNSLELTYVSNPHVGYFGDPTREYTVLFGLVHNLVDFAVSIVAITVFLTVYQNKRHSVAHNQGFDHQMFIQVLLIHAFQLLTTFGFDYIRIFGSSRPLNAFLLVTYMMSQGITPIIYLIFNSTIKSVLVTQILRISYSQRHSVSVNPKSQYVKSNKMVKTLTVQ